MRANGDENSAGLRGRPGIRPARRSDGEALIRLLTQLHPAYPPDPERAEEVIDAASREPHRTLMVATIDDEVVGTADLVIVSHLTHGGRPWAIVENVVVDEGRRQQGIGRALVDEIGAITEAAGCYMVQLLSLNHRHEAHAFYASLGYAPVARGFRQYREGFEPSGPNAEPH